MEFRRAVLSDVNSLVELRKQQLIDEGIEPVIEIDNDLAEYFTQGLADNSFISWVAEENGEIIATSGLCFYRLLPTYTNPTGHIAYVTNMFTVMEYRRQGIPSQLLELIIDEAKKLNYQTIRLHSSREGNSLYSQYGFITSESYMKLTTAKTHSI